MTYRVIQWATGAMGKTCLRAILDHPDLELAGLYVHSDRKVGRDAGEIARRQTTGILATGNPRPNHCSGQCGTPHPESANLFRHSIKPTSGSQFSSNQVRISF